MFGSVMSLAGLMIFGVAGLMMYIPFADAVGVIIGTGLDSGFEQFLRIYPVIWILGVVASFVMFAGAWAQDI